MSSEMNKKEEIAVAIKSIFEAIMADTNLEIEQRIQALPQETKEMLMDERNDYWIRRAISEISDMIVVMRGFSLTKSVAVDLFDGSLESFFRRYMSKTEGSGCSTDKAKFICRKIKESIKKDENLSLYDDYTGVKQIAEERWKEQAYWSPKKIKDTDEAKRIYIDWMNLKHIHPEQ